MTQELTQKQDNYLQTALYERGVTGEDRELLAAQIAIQTAREWQQKNPDKIEVIFNVFKDSDYEICKRLPR